jgi:hypothetical protein
MRLFPLSFFTLALSITGGSLLSGHATANTVATTAAEQLYQPQPNATATGYNRKTASRCD